MQPEAAAPPSDEADGVSGRRVIFLLFAALWIATLASLLWFARIGDAQYGDMTDRVYYALAGNLVLPVIAWFVFSVMPRNRHLRPARRVRPWAMAYAGAGVLGLNAVGLLAFGLRWGVLAAVWMGVIAFAFLALHIANLAAQKVWLDDGLLTARSLWRRVRVPCRDVVELRLEPAPGWAMAFVAHLEGGAVHRIRLASFEENTLAPLADELGLVPDDTCGQPGALRWSRPSLEPEEASDATERRPDAVTGRRSAQIPPDGGGERPSPSKDARLHAKQ